ncbi:MAG: ribose-phosphate pyrophosphokinase, partial [Selenomonadaceae bacterium]
GAKALAKMGVKDVYACCSHAILSDPAVKRINESPIKELIITDSIPLPADKKSEKIVSLSIADMLGDAITLIYQQKSVSQLFHK